MFPGAVERCNGVDDDCDGRVDADAVDGVARYVDADGDGFGGDTQEQGCLAGEGLSDEGGDCDDADATVHPDATEVCGGGDEDCDGLVDEADPSLADAAPWYADADGDGFGAGEAHSACAAPDGAVGDATDCDDADPGVHPSAAEACDGVDQDCDGIADDGAAVPLFADADGDGWGDDTSALAACPVPDGWVEVAGDCDDGDPGVSPSGVEVCDDADVDEDCDGLADDADPDAAGLSWYADADGDTYGDPAVTSVACEAAGAVLDGTDCDDDDSAVHPDAIEVCDGVDEDCDGDTDEDAADTSTWFADTDGDGYGDAAATTTGCDAPSGYGADDTDCDDTDAAASPAGTEACDDGVDQDCDGIDVACDRLSGTVPSSAAFARLEGGAAGDLAGWAVAFAGDLDGDGGDDLVIGAPGDDTSGAWGGGQGGAVAVFEAGHAGTEPLSDADVTLLGEPSERAGLAVARGGDLWGDGRSWVLVGGMGTAWAVPSPWSMDLSDAYGEGAMVCAEEAADDATGWAVAGAPDADGDGAEEALVGAPYNDDDGTSAGKVYRGCEWYGAAPVVPYWLASWTGEADGDLAGSALSGAGDTDGDGLGDLLVGAPGSDETGTSAGKAYLVLGGDAGDTSLSTADASWTGVSGGDGLGTAVWGGGDLDADGYDDLAVGSDGAGVWVILGPATGAAGVASASLRLEPEDPADRAGLTVSGGADVDGDGAADLVVGAPAGDRGATDGGVVYVLAGPPGTGTVSLSTPDAFVVGVDTDGAAGWSLDATGDADADGIADILVGAPGLDAEAGGALLLLGGP